MQSINLADFEPETPCSAVKRHKAKIHEADLVGPDQARCSTTEAIMVALALCNRAYLPNCMSNVHAGHLWWRLDDGQRAAVSQYGAEAGLGGDIASPNRSA